MAYSSNYYNYQVAVIFAIVIAAALLLAAVVGGIYFICVVNMRKQKGFSRAPSALSRSGRYGGSVWQAPPIEPKSQSIIVGAGPGYDTNVPIVQPIDYQRSQPSPYSAAAAAMTYGQQQQPQGYVLQQQAYQPQYTLPMAQPQQLHPDTHIRDIHPEYVYQQGSITLAQQPSEPTQGYHMSSV